MPAVTTTPAAVSQGPAARVPALDGLRGLAALAVFVFHVWLYTRPVPGPGNRGTTADFVVHELRLGLIAFFVLSAFLLYRPFLDAAMGDRPRPALGPYLRARVARIAPAYYIVLIASIALLWGLGDTRPVRLPPAEQLPLFFLFAQNYSPDSVMTLNPPMWSLVVEVTFYALLPFLGLLALRLPPRLGWQALVPLALVVAGVAYNWALVDIDHGIPATKVLPAAASYFGLGMLAALLVRAWRPNARARAALLVAGVLIVLADATTKAGAAAGWFDPGDVFLITREVSAGAGFAMIVMAVALAPHTRVLGGRTLVFFGAISYGFYLWHVPVLWFLRAHGLLPMDPLLAGLVALPLCVGLAWASWVLVERRAIEWASRRRRRAESDSGRGDAARRRRAREVGAVNA